MYTRELARIKATQKAYEYRHYGRPMQQPKLLEFKDWFQQGIEHYRKLGFSFELVTPSLMRINRPGHERILRTCENFREEYEQEYCSKF